MNTRIIPREIRASRKVNPSPRLDFCWKNIVQEQVEAEAFLMWCRTTEERPLIGELQVSEPTEFSLYSFVKGILP